MTRGAVTSFAVAAVLLLAAAGCSEQPTPPVAVDGGAAALRAVVAAEKSLVYTGYKRTIHGEEGVGRATRMKVSRSAAGRTLLEWGDDDGRPSRRWAYRSRFAWLDDPELLLRNYTVEVDAAASSTNCPAVAWRETRRLTVRARRPGRPSLDLLVDRETSLVLRDQSRDFDGKLWLTNVFDTIEYRAPDDPPAGDPSAEVLAESGAGAEAGPVSLPLAVTFAPDGFVRAGGERMPCGGVREDWTDGLAAFSVIERRAVGAEGAKDGELQRRSCSGRASVSGVFSGFQVTVAGNLPAAELESVVRGLAAVKQ